MEYDRIVDIKRLNFIVDVLKSRLPAGAEVLDVGCGNGIIARNLGEIGYRVKAIDISEKAIARAKELNRFPNVSFEVTSAEQLAADGQLYHAVICSEVLEHLKEPSQLLQVLHKTLHDKGILIVTVPNGKGPRELFVTRPVIALQKKDNWLWKLVVKIKRGLGFNGTTAQSAADDLMHVQFFTKSSLTQLAAANHFRIVKFCKTNFIEDVFPFSIVTRKIKALQKLDCYVAEKLPYQFTGGFLTMWEKAI
jgi:SAM-dependent methyltransferase